MIEFDITHFRTELRRFIRRFELSANGVSAWNYFRIYLTGLLSSLERKNCEAIALQGNMPVRSLQWFLAKLPWDHKKNVDHVSKNHRQRAHGKTSNRYH